MSEIRALVLSGLGINAEKELASAFELAGAKAQFCHVNDLVDDPECIHEYHICAFPGGFSFGDHLGSATVLAHIVSKNLSEEIRKFIDANKLIIGVCNGFQTIAKMAILPDGLENKEAKVSLVHNIHGRFIDDWVELEVNGTNASPWLKNLDSVAFPIRHGEGRFVAEEAVLDQIESKEQVAFRYKDNVNGSYNSIAGITDPSGLILGLMPHPEAYLFPEQHPSKLLDEPVAGLKLFQNAVSYCKENF